MVKPPKFFSPFSPKILLFSKKLLNEKLIKTKFPIKKVIFIFVARRFLPSKKDLGPRNNFLPFSQKITFFFFWKKLLNNKIFNTSFVIKNRYVHFWGKAPPFPKKLSNVSPKQFFTVFSENTAFFGKNCQIKNIQHLISNKKGYIHFSCKMTPDSRKVTQWPCCKQSKGWRGRVPFNYYFYVSKYRSSDALSVPEIFYFPSTQKYRRLIPGYIWKLRLKWGR